ncbi:MAG: VCBS repeat-containing protein, partial [Planctomycetaceae bacterium]|nr:VCBS repeat-containing protein [Planctomycetaceae bacterium]
MRTFILQTLVFVPWVYSPAATAQQNAPFFVLLQNHLPQHVSPLTPQRHIHLTMGSGVGALDYDHDGWIDLCFAQGCPWDGKFRNSEKNNDILLRNARGNVVDCSNQAGLASDYYAMAVSCCDADNDGFCDIAITNVGPDVLWLNNGDGTFTSKVMDSELLYSASATWTDANGDSCPDLFITHYVKIGEDHYPVCTDEPSQQMIVCPPGQYDSVRDSLFISNQDRTFIDASEKSGLASADHATGLSAISQDFDADGDLDLYVANDALPNQLWINDGTGNFQDEGLISGVALNRHGQREAGMGLAFGSISGSGRADIVVTNYFEETNTFYRNEGAGFFQDFTDEIGIGAPSRAKLAFGVNLLDADGDGDQDLFVANGHIHDRLNELGRNIPYEQEPQLLLMDGSRFVDVSSSCGEPFLSCYLGRGSAVLDFDNDLRSDIVMVNLGREPVVLLNRTESHGHVLRLNLVSRRGCRDALGATVTVRTASGAEHTAFRSQEVSYLSSGQSA